MYYLYEKRSNDQATKYEKIREVSLFGCNEGLIPAMIRQGLPKEAKEPHLWHIEIEHGLSRIGHKNNAIVIDLKPKQKETNISLFELLDVWGFSDQGWTPILLRLRGLYVDASPKSLDSASFEPDKKESPISIYEFLYLNGTISDGDLVGKWTAPPASPTNATLLWPETLAYFIKCIRSKTPEISG